MKKKKVLAILLCVSLFASTIFAGCSGPKNTTEKVDDTKNTAAKDTKADTDTASSEEVVTLDMFINMGWYPINSFTGIIPEAITKATGVNLDITITSDTSQLGVMIASGELPDLIFTDAELNRLSDSNLCYSFSELEKNYGASFSDVSDEEKNFGKELSKDGDYYTVLNYYNTAEEWSNLQIGAPGQTCIYYRKDLIEAMGNPAINNLEDFENVLQQCKKAYPDKTPYGLGGYWKFQPLYNWTGALNSQYDGANYYYDSSAPKYKEFLQLANSYAKNGYVTVEAYANESEADSHQAAYNGDCIFYAWYLSYSNLNQLQTEAKKIDPNAQWAVLPRLGEAAMGTGRGWAGTYVSKTCKNVEAAARLLTYLYSEEGSRTSMWGREGIDYTLDQNGVPQFSDEFKAARADGTLKDKYNTFFYNGSSAIDEIYMNYSGLDQNILDQVASYGKDFKSYPEIGMAAPNSSSDEGVIKTKLDELKKSYEAKVIFATTEDEFEAYYKEYMNAMNQTGVEKYNDYMTKKIQELKAKFGF